MRNVDASPTRTWISLIALAALLLIVAFPSDADAARRNVFDSQGSGAARVSSDQGSVTLRLVVSDGARGVLRFHDDPGDTGEATLAASLKRPRYTIFNVIWPGLWVLDGARVWP